MTNSLIKNTTFETLLTTQLVPGTPPTPAQPKRTVYETRTVCGFRYSAPGHYEYTTDPATGQVRMTFFPSDPTASVKGVYSCQVETVPVTYPATPARPGTPPHTIVVNQVAPGYNLGWNSGARSAGIITGNGTAAFQARRVVGAIVGLNLYDGIDAGYSGTTTDFAFLLSNGVARIIKNGVLGPFIGPYNDDTVFSIERDLDGGYVYFYMDGGAVHAAANSNDAPMWLEASLYSGGDEVFNPVLTQTSPPDLTPQTGTMTLTLPPLGFLASQGPHAEMRLEIPQPRMEMTRALPLPNYAVMALVMPPLAPQFSGLTGEIGGFTLTMEPLDMLAADHDYGAMRLTLPPIEADFDATEGNGHASMASIGNFSADIKANKFLIVTMTSQGVIVTAMEASIHLSAEMLSTATMTSLWSLESIQQAIMRSVAYASSITGVPGGDMETWVINMESLGSTSYSAYAFNSYATIAGRHYGASSAGLFELAGDTDDGDPIRAGFSPGKLDFGTSAKKTVDAVYVGMSANGNLFIKLEAEGQTLVYKTDTFSDEMKQQRVQLGRGLRTSYVTPYIYNEDGQDFEIDSLEFMVVPLTKKV